MTTAEKPDARLQAIIAALSLNRGEIESAKLAELLRLLESEPEPLAAR